MQEDFLKAEDQNLSIIRVGSLTSKQELQLELEPQQPGVLLHLLLLLDLQCLLSDPPQPQPLPLLDNL